MPLPNLLATRRGRLAAFFVLYIAEGIPAGFTGTALGTQMRRHGLDPAVIGSFLAILYVPWAIKWAFGPFVDVLSIDRWGRRRFWILLTQALMVAALLAAMPVDFAAHLGLFTALMLLVNLFSAVQDVAIDALAVNVLRDDERGIGNGLMFGGHYLGIAIGGAGVLLLTSAIGFAPTFLFVAGAILIVTLAIAAPMREPIGPPRPAGEGPRVALLAGEILRFARDAGRAFVGSRPAFVAIFLALLPMGAYSLGLALQTNLAVELGMDDRAVGFLGMGCTALSATFCVLGGWLSDRFGRRRTLALFIAGTTLPAFAMAVAMQRAGWILPIDPLSPGRPVASAELVTVFCALALAYALFQGLMYGVGTAIYMDVTTARVAATQFTAYMALCNVTYSYSAAWQGAAAVRWGYPTTLVIDGLFGLVCLLLLPLMGRATRRAAAHPATLADA